MVLASATGDDLVIAEIETAPRPRRRGWNAAANPAVADEYVRLVTGSR
jgi:hypothetical protein